MRGPFAKAVVRGVGSDFEVLIPARSEMIDAVFLGNWAGVEYLQLELMSERLSGESII